MSDVIKLLPDSVANQIAAGEVIQRPASVVKELVENAVDAQASAIQILLKDAGRTLIQVIDNGLGMSDTDARLSFERHSTSKIRNADDLFALQTMGFRGEALASIAAISHIELRTCARGSQLGTKLLINASHCESQEPDVCPSGSNFMVKDLFFNVPARRKFLKSNQVELSNIIKEFEKLALVNFNIDFSLSHNGNVLYKLRPGTFKQRIVDIFGSKLDQQLIPLAIETSLVKITGFVGKPENARKRNALQYFFVNGRFMRHPYFHKAVISCYDELIPDDAQPNYFLIFDVDPESIDVNIHPTKTEIKFENEMPIWQILSASVKETLGRFGIVPSIDFDKEDAPDIPAFSLPHVTTPPSINIDKSYNPFKETDDVTNGSKGCSRLDASKSNRDYSSNSMPNWEELYKNFEKSKQDSFDDYEDTSTDEKAPVLIVQEEATRFLQLDNRYILALSHDGVLIIDQHRAHLAVLYERLLQQIDGMNVLSQRVLFPEVVHFSAAQNALFVEIAPDLEKAGFGLSRLSGDDWAINSVPPGLDNNVDIVELLNDVIAMVDNGGNDIKSKVYENIALTIASKAAIPHGRPLNDDEMKTLLDDWMSLKNNKYTPNGKVIANVLTLDQIAKMF